MINEPDNTSSFDNRPKSLHLVNGESSEHPPAYGSVMVDGDGRKKSVTFAATSPTLSNTSSQISPNTPSSTHPINIPGM